MKIKILFLITLFLMLPIFVGAQMCTVSKIAILPWEWESGDDRVSLRLESQDSSGNPCNTEQTIRFAPDSSVPGEFLRQGGEPLGSYYYISRNSHGRNFYYTSSTGLDDIIIINAGYDTGNGWEIDWTTSARISDVIGSNDSDGEINGTSSSSDGSITTPSTHDASIELSPTASKSSKPLTIDPGRERLVSVGAPVKFRAKLSNTGRTERIKVEWSFGDGASKRGEVATHAYKFPGSYIVVANAYQGVEQAVGRTRVEVIEPAVELGEVVFAPEPYAELINRSGGELNLGHWQMKFGEQIIKLPLDTLLAAGGRLRLPFDKNLLKRSTVAQIELLYPNGVLVDVAGPESSLLAPNQDLPSSLAAEVARLQAQLTALTRSASTPTRRVARAAALAPVIASAVATTSEEVRWSSSTSTLAEAPREVVVIEPARSGWWGRVWHSLSGVF